MGYETRIDKSRALGVTYHKRYRFTKRASAVSSAERYRYRLPLYWC